MGMFDAHSKPILRILDKDILMPEQLELYSKLNRGIVGIVYVSTENPYGAPIYIKQNHNQLVEGYDYFVIDEGGG